ncbi:Hypothetical predicted protein [Octopus vulgaris]|uniref:Uncharacterized protein n=1 Tax=Octopus vulgaris TaxID=6645 RepID=A0AA36AVD1_OCTVU|nr:Hypothetical predicted protein [Octopus vulgaris]
MRKKLWRDCNGWQEENRKEKETSEEKNYMTSISDKNTGHRGGNDAGSESLVGQCILIYCDTSHCYDISEVCLKSFKTSSFILKAELPNITNDI